MKDLVVGLAMGYDWEKIEPFAISLVRSGFAGDKVLFVKELTNDAMEKLHSLGFFLFPIPETRFSDSRLPQNKYFPYVGRFLLIHKFLEEHRGEYRFVVCSDVRDVVFQGDPTVWLEENIGDKKLVVAPEYILHRDQPGNVQWIDAGFKEVEEWMLPQSIYCSGFISGVAGYVADLALGVYLAGRHLSSNVWGADQPVYNSIMHQRAYADITLVPKLADNYCINMVVLADEGTRPLMTDAPPVARFDSYGEPMMENLWLYWNHGIADLGTFTVIHQYDRIGQLSTVLRNQYSLKSCREWLPFRFDLSKF